MLSRGRAAIFDDGRRGHQEIFRQARKNSPVRPPSVEPVRVVRRLDCGAHGPRVFPPRQPTKPSLVPRRAPALAAGFRESEMRASLHRTGSTKNMVASPRAADAGSTKGSAPNRDDRPMALHMLWQRARLHDHFQDACRDVYRWRNDGCHPRLTAQRPACRRSDPCRDRSRACLGSPQGSRQRYWIGFRSATPGLVLSVIPASQTRRISRTRYREVSSTRWIFRAMFSTSSISNRAILNERLSPARLSTA